MHAKSKHLGKKAPSSSPIPFKKRFNAAGKGIMPVPHAKGIVIEEPPEKVVVMSKLVTLVISTVDGEREGKVGENFPSYFTDSFHDDDYDAAPLVPQPTDPLLKESALGELMLVPSLSPVPLRS